ncbi:MAG TPA: HutD family protein [Planctomycetota bacterium]|nr:HutD family protein [Planctomycetota bacterium]
MRTLRRLAASDARRVPWKNGRGVTEELALWPPGASWQRGDFDWRLSRAAVDEPGPFSAFPGLERVLVVTSGAGLRLRHGRAAPRARVALLQPYRFSGDWPTEATLVDGPVEDFSVLARRGVVRADVTVLRPGPASLHVRELLAPGHTFVHVLSGTVEAQVSGELSAAGRGVAGALQLAARESLWIHGALEPAQIELGGGAQAGVVLLVQFVGDGTATGASPASPQR